MVSYICLVFNFVTHSSTSVQKFDQCIKIGQFFIGVSYDTSITNSDNFMGISWAVFHEYFMGLNFIAYSEDIHDLFMANQPHKMLTFPRVEDHEMPCLATHCTIHLPTYGRWLLTCQHHGTGAMSQQALPDDHLIIIIIVVEGFTYTVLPLPGTILWNSDENSITISGYMWIANNNNVILLRWVLSTTDSH